MSAQKKAGTPGPLCAHLSPSLKVEAGPGDPRFRVGAEQAGGNGSIPQTAAPSAVERRLRGPCCRGAVCPGGVGWSSQHGPTCELRVCPRVRVTVSACRQDVCCSYTARTRAVCARQCVCTCVCAHMCAGVGLEGWAPAGSPPRRLQTRPSCGEGAGAWCDHSVRGSRQWRPGRLVCGSHGVQWGWDRPGPPT